jgi:predicted DNA-binding transcriptional regulator YafY
MDKVLETDKSFECRNVPIPDFSPEKVFPGNIHLKALFTPDVKWRLVEEFGPNCYEVIEDGRLLITEDYSDLDNLVTWLFTFGDKVVVLEPKEVREKLKSIAEAIVKKYE